MAGYKHTPEARAKISAAKSGAGNPNYGKQCPWKKEPLPRETIQALLDAGKTMRQMVEELGLKRGLLQKWMRLYGIKLTKEQQCGRLRRGTDHHKFSGYEKDSNGYRYLAATPGHMSADQCGYVPEHRLVIERLLGRELTHSETVHHVNFSKKDNRIENLILFRSGSQHAKFHKWMELCGAYAIGAVDEKPMALEYDPPILAGGKWVSSMSYETFKTAIGRG